MTNINKQSMKEYFRNKIGAAILILLGVVVVAAFITNCVPSAKADTKSLEDSVRVEQADYDMNLKTAQDAMVQHCEDWKALALAKIDLADSLKMPTNLDKAEVTAVVCDSPAIKLVVPYSFM